MTQMEAEGDSVASPFAVCDIREIRGSFCCVAFSALAYHSVGSYPLPDHPSSPAAVPELPERPPAKFQFSLKHLLAFMLASAFLAAGVRFVMQLLQALPGYQFLSWFNTVIGSLAFGGLAYFFFRVPFLALQIERLGNRWNAVRKHRRELEDWSRERLKQRSQPPEPPSSFNP